MRLKQLLVEIKTPIDQPNIHNIDNSTANNNMIYIISESNKPQGVSSAKI